MDRQAIIRLLVHQVVVTVHGASEQVGGPCVAWVGAPSHRGDTDPPCLNVWSS